MAIAVIAHTFFAFSKDLYRMPPTAGAEMAAVIAALMSLCLGVGLGAGLGSRELGENVIHFALTRPQRREVMLWTAWGMGLLELTATVGAFAIYSWAICCMRGRGFDLWQALCYAGAQEALLGGWLMLSVSYALTAATRRDTASIVLTLTLAMGYTCLRNAMATMYDVHLPRLCREIYSLPLKTSMGIWFALGVAFVLASQMVIERREA